MSDYLTNQLYFKSNTKTILSFLKSKASRGTSPPLFSLNSIRQMPASLQLTLTPALIKLSMMNMEMPAFKENARQAALKNVFSGEVNKKTTAELLEIITDQKKSLQGSDLNLLEQAAANYQQFKFFSQYDWCMSNWGTLEDIHAVVESSFSPSTTCIEFETLYTPPIVALQMLADTFPSVRFRLSYRYNSEETWSNMEIFPLTPFGY